MALQINAKLPVLSQVIRSLSILYDSYGFNHGGNTTKVGTVYQLLLAQGASLAPKLSIIECSGRDGY
jgi:hypothetical protein